MKEFSLQQVDVLKGLLSADRVSTGQSNRELHLRDVSPHRGVLPACVVWPESTEEVSAVLQWTYENDIPVVPWGAGTSIEGNPV
ncbi:MAG: FAD-binding protein, partial [Desulfobacterales bacterium]